MHFAFEIENDWRSISKREHKLHGHNKGVIIMWHVLQFLAHVHPIQDEVRMLDGSEHSKSSHCVHMFCCMWWLGHIHPWHYIRTRSLTKPYKCYASNPPSPSLPFAWIAIVCTYHNALECTRQVAGIVWEQVRQTINNRPILQTDV